MQSLGEDAERRTGEPERGELEPLPHLTDHAVYRIVTRFINGGVHAEAETFLRAQWPTRRRVLNPRRKRHRLDTLYYRCDGCVFVLDRSGATTITVWPCTYSRKWAQIAHCSRKSITNRATLKDLRCCPWWYAIVVN